MIPRQTLLIELPIAVMQNSSNKDLANKFVQFLKSPASQAVFGQNGFRPVNPVAAKQFKNFPVRPGQITLNDKTLGGFASGAGALVRAVEGPDVRDRVCRRRAFELTSYAEPRPRERNRIIQFISSEKVGTAFSLGYASTFLLVIVALPIAALIWQSKEGGWSAFWESISAPEAVAALKLTLTVAALAALTNAVLGTVTAWVLVRDDFRGKSVLNAVIDLPFALPTIVAGLLLLTFYGPRSPIGVHLAFTRYALYVALLFVTLPFVIRTVQPVLLELDHEMEEAARSLGANQFTVFRRIVLPNILPGILSGVTMAFARAVGEIGAVVIITGNIPYRTEVSSVFIFNQIASQNATGAAAVAVVLLTISFVVLLLVGGIRRLATRHERV